MKKPRKRKLPPGVVGMAEFKERKRLEQIRENARAFLKLSPEERMRQLMGAVQITVKIGPE